MSQSHRANQTDYIAPATGRPLEIPVQLHPRIREVLAHVVDVLNSSDSDHPAFKDSGADTVALLWHKETDIKELAAALGLEIEVPTYTNRYRCTECGEKWENEDTVQCNDRCPRCNAETEPCESVDTKPLQHDESRAVGMSPGLPA